MTATETATWLLERDDFLIITHRRPDGDTLGSAGALAVGLRSYGKSAYLLYNEDITPRYEPFVKDFIASADYSPKCVIAVDTASLDLFTESAYCYADNVDLCIDHHPSNENYAKHLCLEGHMASCGEVIYDVLSAMKCDIDTCIAELLYLAVSTDTGCFSYGNTTSNSLLVASKLVEAGADNTQLNKQLFRTKTQNRIKIESMITSSLEYYFDGRVAIGFITRDMMDKTKAVEDDLDDIAAIPTSVEGVCVGITIRELSSPHDCKISVRSLAPYDASEICMHFGGGGHMRAAGAVIKKTVYEIRDELLKFLERYNINI